MDMHKQFLKAKCSQLVDYQSYLNAVVKQLTLVSTRSQTKMASLLRFVKKASSTFAQFSKTLQEITFDFMTKQAKEISQQDESLIGIKQSLNSTMLYLSTAFKQLSQKVQSEVLQPAKTYIQNYKQNLAKDIEELLLQIKMMGLYRQHIRKANQKCLQLAQQKEEIFMIMINRKEMDMQTDQSSYRSKIDSIYNESSQQEESCENVIREANMGKLKLQALLGETSQKLQRNEESRISFSKSLILNILRQLSSLLKGTAGPLDHLIQQQQSRRLVIHRPSWAQIQLSEVTQQFYDFKGLKLFLKQVKELKQEQAQISSIPHSFQLNQNQIHKLKKVTAILMEETHDASSDQLAALAMIKMLVIDNPCCAIFLVHWMARTMALRKVVRVHECRFKEAGTILKLIIQSFQDNRQVILALIQKAVFIVSRYKKVNCQESLSQRLAGLPLFQDYSLWLDLCERILHSGQIEQIRTKRASGRGLMTKGIRLIKNIWKGEQRQSEDNAAVLQQILSIFVTLSLCYETCLEIMMKLCRRYQLPKATIFYLLDQVQQLKPQLSVFSKQGSQNLRIGLLTALKLAVQYLGLKDKPLRLTLLSKHLRPQLRQRIFKHIAFKGVQLCMEAQIMDYRQFCSTIWSNYLQCRISPLGTGRSADVDIIRMDVERSLHIHRDYIKIEDLKRMLVHYSSSRQINYCQGMNYLAGISLIFFNGQPEPAYSFFQKIMARHFQSLFQNELAQVKLKAYQVNRLINIFVPELSLHLRNELVNLDGMLVSWIITAFSTAFQFTLWSGLVADLWQLLVVDGWKSFFRFVVWLFRQYQPFVIQMKNQEIMNFFGQIQKSALFVNKTPPSRFKEQLRAIKITRRLLGQLERQLIYQQQSNKFNHK